MGGRCLKLQDGASNCSIGVWDDQTSSGEQSSAESDFQGGTYGILSANWGGKWKDETLNNHMNEDLKKTPCQVLCLQEAEDSLRLELENALRVERGLSCQGASSYAFEVQKRTQAS